MAIDVEAQIRETFVDLTRWGELAKQGFAPEAGSPLTLDEQVFEWLPTSDIAWQALCAGQDHLKVSTTLENEAIATVENEASSVTGWTSRTPRGAHDQGAAGRSARR